jgi:hypothetical protein
MGGRADRGDVHRVKILLRYGADPNLGIRTFALHQAAGELYTAVLELLLEAGANPLLKNMQGSTAVVVACMRVKHDLSTLQVLRRYEADFVSVNVFGRGPVSAAAPRCSGQCIDFLVQQGARLDEPGDDLPLAVAIRYGNSSSACAILRHRPISHLTSQELLYVLEQTASTGSRAIIEVLTDQRWPRDILSQISASEMNSIRASFEGRLAGNPLLETAYRLLFAQKEQSMTLVPAANLDANIAEVFFDAPAHQLD